jgi:hypothetical protein
MLKTKKGEVAYWLLGGASVVLATWQFALIVASWPQPRFDQRLPVCTRRSCSVSLQWAGASEDHFADPAPMRDFPKSAPWRDFAMIEKSLNWPFRRVNRGPPYVVRNSCARQYGLQTA